MRDTYDGKIKEGDLNESYIKQTYAELNDAAAAGYGKDWNKVNGKESGEPDPAVIKMQRNLYKFSGAKNFAMSTELNEKLYKDGKLVDFEEFKKEALKLNDKYNVNYLQAEYQTARQSGHHAQNWGEYVRNIDLFPNLKYKTQGDDRVRPEHEKLDGIVAPINSAFWDRFYPPNGWRCRCFVVQTAENATRDIPEDSEDVLPEFKINVGKSGQTFSEGTGETKPHSYFALAKEQGGEKLKLSFELSKLNAPFNTTYKAKKGGKIEVSIFTDLQDLPRNYEVAVTMADSLNKTIQLRPHLDTNIAKGYTNPEYNIDGKLADRKSIKGTNNLRKVIDEAKLQMYDSKTNEEKDSYIIVLDLDGIVDLDLKDLRTQLNRKITPERGKNIYSICICRNGVAVEITRNEIVARDYAKLDKIQ